LLNSTRLLSRVLKKSYSNFNICKKISRNLLEYRGGNLSGVDDSGYLQELKAFYIFKKDLNSRIFRPFIIDDEKSIEIKNYQDWWVVRRYFRGEG